MLHILYAHNTESTSKWKTNILPVGLVGRFGSVFETELGLVDFLIF